MAKPCPTCNAILDFGEEELRQCYMTGQQVCSQCSVFVDHLGYCLKNQSKSTVEQQASKYHMEQLEGMLKQNEEMADILKKEIDRQAERMYDDHLDEKTDAYWERVKTG